MALLRISEDRLIEACQRYKELTDSGTIKRADWWHFAAWVGECAEDLTLIVKYGGRTVADADGDGDAGRAAEASKYGRAAEELRRLATYIRGQYSTAPAWGGASSSKALFNQKQDFDGCALVDKTERQTSGDITVKLVGDFGGVADPFA